MNTDGRVFCTQCGDPISRSAPDGPYVDERGSAQCWGPYGDTWRAPRRHKPRGESVPTTEEASPQREF